MTEQQSTPTEEKMISSLTSEQLLLVSAWLNEEAHLRAAEYSEEAVNSLQYISQRLEILAANK